MQQTESTISKKRGKSALAEIGRVASPEAMLEALCELNIDMKWAVSCLKEIADNGGKMAQIEAVRSLVAMMIEVHIVCDSTTPGPYVENHGRPSRKIDAVILQAQNNAEKTDEAVRGQTEP